jgi:hypothetical protein
MKKIKIDIFILMNLYYNLLDGALNETVSLRVWFLNK